MSNNPSIQAFFPPSSSPARSAPSSPAKAPPSSPPVDVGLDASSDTGDLPVYSTPQPWTPQKDYDEADIGSLIPGPQSVNLTARVVNFYDQPTPAKAPRAAKGCIKVIVKDDTGALTVRLLRRLYPLSDAHDRQVRLWYANIDYKLRLGQLVSIWTSHVSTGGNGSLSVTSAPLFISMFPERDRSCYFMIQENSDTGVLCKTPLEYNPRQALSRLLTLRAFIDGGHEQSDARVLVMVKSLGPRKKITTKKGEQKETRSVVVFDNTADAVVGIWGPLLLSSVESWTPSQTLLLITNARCDASRRPYISFTAASYIDVDPVFEDADWLRTFTQTITRRQHANPPFPDGVFDVEQWLESGMKALFRLSDIDDFIRSAPHETFIGFLSVVILELHISLLHMRNMLFCDECCGVPVYADTLLAICKQCQRPVGLRLNPKVLGILLDETGSVGPGKVVFSSTAWAELFGRSEQQLADLSTDGLRYLERRMSGLRVSLIFGWAGAKATKLGGRLCVLGVRQ